MTWLLFQFGPRVIDIGKPYKVTEWPTWRAALERAVYLNDEHDINTSIQVKGGKDAEILMKKFSPKPKKPLRVAVKRPLRTK
jgi:hypothetical protein